MTPANARTGAVSDLPQSSRLPLGDACLPPRGWSAMIEAHPAEKLGAPGEILLNADTLLALLAVRQDMAAWAYIADPAGKDAWDAAAERTGDCEDWCLSARRAAAARGFPREAFRIAICRIESGADHAVLVATTDRGDFVLDLHKPGLWAWADLPYQWIAVECPRYGWRSIPPPVTLADLAQARS